MPLLALLGKRQYGTRLSTALLRSVGSGMKPDPTERSRAATILYPPRPCGELQATPYAPKDPYALALVRSVAGGEFITTGRVIALFVRTPSHNILRPGGGVRRTEVGE